MAKRSTLAKVGAILWAATGCGLLSIAYARFMPVPGYTPLVVLGGIILGILMYRSAFSRLVKSNIARLRQLSPERNRVCVFAFINVRGYAIILFMSLLGYTLRLLQVSRLIMAPAYTAIGLALILASIRYYKLSLKLQ